MRRLFVLIILVILVSWAVHARRSRPGRHAPPPVRWSEPGRSHDRPAPTGRDFASEAHRQVQEALTEAREAIDEAHHEVRHAWREAREEIRDAWTEMGDDVLQSYDEVLASDDVPAVAPVPPVPPTPPPPPASPSPHRVEVEGLPVAIVPGTRVTVAEVRPPAPPRPPARPRKVSRAPRPAPHAPRDVPAVAPVPARIVTVTGLISATEERAQNEGRKAVRDEVVKWLDPEVSRSWTPPARLLEAMVRETRISPVVKEYGTLYLAELEVELSADRRAALVGAYNRELVRHRLAGLGGMLAFVLIGLAAVSSYIRADEATKGYYTNRLRLLAAAGVGAGGVILYRMMV